jgi:uncharacterized membrane protein YhaH (DUF805 family)
VDVLSPLFAGQWGDEINRLSDVLAAQLGEDVGSLHPLWAWLTFVLMLWLLFARGTPGPNRFGPAPIWPGGSAAVATT